MRVVLDANVLYPAALRDCLLRAAAADLYQVYWSVQILEEMRRNLVGSGRVTQHQAEHLLDQMRRAFPAAIVDDYEHLVPDMLVDAGDRHVAAAAVAIGAHVIVTENLRHFPAAALAPFRAEALAADAFLQRLLEKDAAAMVRVVERVAAARHRPPRTFAEVLDEVARMAPGFARRLGTQVDRASGSTP